ncbi:MAG: response regulator transcription factor [Betaproteobacteria bacterium]|nr:response regulator transcription factor [Betaproteobacteria bacterium]
MATNIFVSRSKLPPARWREAFPTALIGNTLPERIPSDALVWLHNLSPADFAGALPKGVHIIALHDEPSDENGLAALSTGAAGYANAHATPQLLHTIESVVRSDGLWVGEALLNRLLRTLAAVPAAPVVPPPESHPALVELSEREREVALKVVRGESNKEIARDLDIAERTVKAHLSAIFEKLGVRDRLQLALLLKAAP